MNQKRLLKNILLLGGDSFTLPRCETCEQFREETYTCNAFPDGIPDDILWKNTAEECAPGFAYKKA